MKGITLKYGEPIGFKASSTFRALLLFLILIVLLPAFTQVADAANETILVATNRFVILDDPNDAGANVVTGSGFQIPTPNDWGSRSTIWAGNATTINATAMYIDDNGFPVSGKIINFTLLMPNGTALITRNDTTNSLGLANFSYNLDNKNFYGRWQVRAGNGSIGENTSFIYNWFGCSWSGGTCGNQHGGATPLAGGTANSPYLSGRNYDTGITQHTSHGADWTNSDTNACTHCHQSFDNNTGDAYTARYDNKPADVHRNVTCDNANCHGTYTTHNTDQLVFSCYNSGCHGNATAWDRKDISNKSTLSGAVSMYSYKNASTFNATFHTPNSTVPCIICHGPMHNISKPNATFQRFTRNQATESEQCTACHSTYNNHNKSNTTSGGVNCTLCHSDDVHNIQVFAQNATYVDLNRNNPNPMRGNCTNCHQNAAFFAALEAQPRTGNYTGRDPPVIPNPLKHSSNLSNGSLWNSTSTPYWRQANASCYYCHGDTKHNATAIGKVSVLLNSNNVRNGTSLAASGWCADCHYNATINTDYKGSQWTQAPPLITVNNTGKNNWVNHSGYLTSGYNDSNCKSCHALNVTTTSYLATSLNYSHSLNEGVAGGPNCIECHNLVTGLNGAPAGINFTAMNASVHYGMNSNNATNQGYAPVIGACWACHDSNGNVTSGHPDRYKAPKVCTDCHLGTGTYNASAYNAIVVSEHYYSGTDIKAGNSTSNIASCINCHENVSEMILSNNVTDNYGSFPGDGVGLNGGNMSFYHYGKPRTDLRVGSGSRESNCLYCHQNLTTSFTIAMENPSVNKSIYNHTDNPAQRCANCHGLNSWLHNSTLTIPNGGVLDNSYCLTCHQPGTGGARAIPDTHNVLGVNCWKCHQDPNTTANPMNEAPIHGMMYAQTNGSYQRFVKGTPANCTTCHINDLVNTTPYTATRIPALNHSVDPYSGMKWNGTQTRFWDNTSMITACNYCHQSELHNVNAALLGNVSTIQGSNQLKSSNLANSRWCAACHYNDSTSNYKGSLLPKVPPEILNRTGTVPVLASDGTAFYNHSSDVAANSNDSKCLECHSLVGSYAQTTLNYSHSLNEGGGGPDCLSSGCHGSTGSTSSPYMNWTSLKSGMHSNLTLSGADTAGTTDPIVAACWACHGDGTRPSAHPTNYKQPYYCADCHLASGSITGRYNATNVTQHQHVDAQVRTNSTYARCENCHNNSLVAYSDNEVNTLTNYTLGNVSHYGANKTAGKLMEASINSTNCVYCHLNNSNRQKWANATNASATKPDIHGNYNATTQSSTCWGCHVNGGISAVTSAFTLHNTSLTPGASEACLTCHVSGGVAQNLSVNSSRMGLHINLNNTPTNTLNNSDCWSCHFGYPNGTRGSHSYNVSRQNTYYCEDCHWSGHKNATAVADGIAASSKNIANFKHGDNDCGGCHLANDSRKPSGSRVLIYHNNSAKRNASGVVSNPGWEMINGLFTGCNDCHRVQNTQDGPFHAPGYLHYTTTSSDCSRNCHGLVGSNTDPHYQLYQPCYDFPTCSIQSRVSPPTLSSMNLTPSPVARGSTTRLTARAWDNYNIIENATYQIINSSGTVVGWTVMTPTDGHWGPASRIELIEATIPTSSLSPGIYTVQVKAMAGGPRVKSGRYYPDNGEWSDVYSITVEVTS